jgi:hypothetical protein
MKTHIFPLLLSLLINSSEAIAAETDRVLIEMLSKANSVLHRCEKKPQNASILYYKYRFEVNKAAEDANVSSQSGWANQVIASMNGLNELSAARKHLIEFAGVTAVNQVDKELPRLGTFWTTTAIRPTLMDEEMGICGDFDHRYIPQ